MFYRILSFLLLLVSPISVHGGEFVRIGVDVGGTNTDAVLFDGSSVLAHVKTGTTADITGGIVTAVTKLFNESHYPPEKVQSFIVGTTYLLNSLIQRKNLNPVLVLRLAYPSTTGAPPAISWPKELEEVIFRDSIHILKGGYEFNGVEISQLDREELGRVTDEMDADISSVAIIGVFSNVNALQEKEVAKYICDLNPFYHLSLSHQFGGLGLLQRENATILNASLMSAYMLFQQAMQNAMSELGMNCPLYLSKGTGTIEPVSISRAQSPILTLNSGPTNSIRGGGILAHVSNAVIADIGGTTTDIGVLKEGFPVLESSPFIISGVSCNFPSPRIHSFGLGGGSIVRVNKEGTILIGPDSVGYELDKKAVAFGGTTLTATDIAIAKGRLTIGNINANALRMRIARLHPSVNIDQVDLVLHKKLTDGVANVLASMESIPDVFVLVGGGAVLFDQKKLKLDDRFETIVIPELSGVANAAGATIAQIEGRYSQVYNYADIPRQQAIEEATAIAKKIAVAKGAIPSSLKVTEMQEIPLNYLSGDPNQLTIVVVGDLGHDCTLDLSSTEFEIENISVESPDLTGDVREKIQVEYEKRVLPDSILSKVRSLNEESIKHIALGAGLLGSGGGGSPDLGSAMAVNALQNGHKIYLISAEDLPGNALVVAFGFMGSPTVLSERLPSIDEGLVAIQEIEKLGKKVDAILPVEAAGCNSTYPFLLASVLGIPIVDADCMGRALPGIDMVTPNIYGDFEKYMAALSNGRRCELVQADAFLDLEKKARALTVKMGGVVTLAYLPMNGKQVREWTIPKTLSIAEKMGRSLDQTKGMAIGQRLEVLNQVLSTTDYQRAERIFEGRIAALRRKEVGGFSLGGFIVEDLKTSQCVEVGFQNENLVVRDCVTKEVCALVPDLITIVDRNTLHTISCEDLTFGQEVVIIKMTAPRLMATEKAMQVVGPDAYPLAHIFNLLDSCKVDNNS